MFCYYCTACNVLYVGQEDDELYTHCNRCSIGRLLNVRHFHRTPKPQQRFSPTMELWKLQHAVKYSNRQ